MAINKINYKGKEYDLDNDLPEGAIIPFDGDEIPEGYEEDDNYISSLIKQIGILGKTVSFADFNTLPDYGTGLFACMDSTNMPVDVVVNHFYTLQIKYSANHVLQIATTLLIPTSYKNKIYMRKKVDGTWTSWTSITFS